MFSIIIPTRNRTKYLTECISSFYTQASSLHRDELQFVLAVDSDDNDTIGILPGLVKNFPLEYIISPFIGNHTKYLVNLPAKLSNRPYIITPNDECLMQTRCWDVILKTNIDGFLLDKPDRLCYSVIDDDTHARSGILWTHGCCFPVVTREVVNLFNGVFPEEIEHQGADTALYKIFQSTDRVLDCTHVKMLHRSPVNGHKMDETYLRGIKYSVHSQLKPHQLLYYKQLIEQEKALCQVTSN